jgi:hypothetical protein
MQIYLHGVYGQVRIVSRFKSHVNIQTSMGLKAVQMRELRPLQPPQIDPVNPPPEPTPQVTPPAVPSARSYMDAEEQAEHDQAQPVPNVPQTAETKANELDERIDLNSTQTQIVQLSGIGRKKAQRIIFNRPQDGYVDFNHFRDLNTWLYDDEEAWKRLEPLVKFGVV